MTECVLRGCGDRAVARQVCLTHYQQLQPLFDAAVRRVLIPTGSDTPVTDLRDDNAMGHQAWRDAHPDRHAEAARERRELTKQATVPGAARSGQPWTEAEYLVLMSGRPLIEIAVELGRTYDACVMQKRRRLKQLGLKNDLIKQEIDPYDGNINRKNYVNI